MPCNKFLPDRDIPDQSGKVIFVTGGNSGIGYETVKALLLKNAKLPERDELAYLAARSKSKGMEAIQQLQTETGRRAELITLDLADLRSVRKAAEEFLSKEPKLDVLFNNGGVMTPPTDLLTEQKYDLQFGTNVLGHFFLIELLLPALIASHEHHSIPARIINTSSAAYSFAPKSAVFMDAAKDGPARDALIKKSGSMMAPMTLYGASKTGNIFVANHYAKAYPGVLVSCSLHPGLIQTGLQRHSAFNRFFAAIAFSPPHVGAYTQLWAGMTATEEEMNGKYFVPVGVEKTLSGAASDRALEAEVIKYLKEAIRGF